MIRLTTGDSEHFQRSFAGVRRPHDPVEHALKALTAGEYVILNRLGRGGMASVYLAHDVALDRLVALKVMDPELLAAPNMRRRFLREARLAARLDHPRIVTVHGVRERAGLVFADLRRVEGTPLDDLIALSSGPISIDVARWLIASIADALHYAHGRGVVHRDVKPANVIVDRRGDPIVADFGIAIAAGSTPITGAGTVLGTPTYMSPEQCLGRTVGPASDQYSLGVVAYELLAGRVPFTGSLHEVQRSHARSTPAPPHAFAPRVPASVSAVVMRMLEKRPADRWPSLAAAAEAMMDGLMVRENRLRRQTASLVIRTTPGVRPQLRPTAIHSAQGRRAAPTQVLPRREPPSPALRRARIVARIAPMALSAAIAFSVARSETVAAAGAIPPGAPFEWDANRRLLRDTLLDQPDTSVARLAVSPPHIRLSVGDSVPLSAMAMNRTGEPVTRRFRWASGDLHVVSVAQDSWIRALAPGRTFVKVAAGNDSAFVLVQVD